ncbi:MAG: O-antigen ligase family protein [Pseudomonadales bacterium]|nr:O-antigen ligase family protein [Pseudomonadales bacterium]
MLGTLRQCFIENRWWDLIFVIYLMLFCIDLVFLQHGRIGSELGFSVRQILFLLLMMTALGNCLRLPQIPLSTMSALLILGVIVPAVWGALGYIGDHLLADIVNDANGHVFYLLGFALLLGYRFETSVLMEFAMSLVLVLCAGCLIAYGYALTGVDQAIEVETFLREGNLGFFNVFVDGRPYRLFLSSFLLVPIMVCFGLQRIIVHWRAARTIDLKGLAFLVVGLGTLLISQTRSLWLGLIVGVLVILLAGYRRMSPRIVLGIGLMAVFGASALLYFVPSLLRLTDVDGNVNMRLEQTVILFNLFTQQPWLGWGFGSVVDLSSITPRPPSFSHEMDLIDLLRKVGLIGALLYGIAYALMLRVAFRLYQLDHDAQEVTFFLMTFGVVFSVGFFNPYVTASIGIGALLLAFVPLAVRFKNQT